MSSNPASPVPATTSTVPATAAVSPLQGAVVAISEDALTAFIANVAPSIPAALLPLLSTYAPALIQMTATQLAGWVAQATQGGAAAVAAHAALVALMPIDSVIADMNSIAQSIQADNVADAKAVAGDDQMIQNIVAALLQIVAKLI